MAEENVILRFASAHVEPSPDYAPGLSHVSLLLRAGELAVVQIGRQSRMPPVADLAEGLLVPSLGRIEFEGDAGAGMSADRAAAGRGRVGRVFAGPAWVSNLDVDENVTLRERHHSGRSPAEVRAAAAELARRFGLENLPATRTSRTSPHDLVRAQWVRALLGAPRLLLLEDPEHDAPENTVGAWRAAVADALRTGAAALWIGPDIPAAPGGIAPRYRFEVRGPDLSLVEERKS